jgi:hypothetical protein
MSDEHTPISGFTGHQLEKLLRSPKSGGKKSLKK